MEQERTIQQPRKSGDSLVASASRQQLIELLDECLNDARMLAIKHRMNTEENQVRLAVALLRERRRELFSSQK
ncbi:hypothetical protein HYX13_04520 [Candidatus Woesearchaeota archaeon]|nr:hypothetical protein [Candidatus Woesearchaeota archaeon]